MGILRIGDNSFAVMRVQQKLNIPADCIFGPATQKAVKLFQAQHGLDIDGIVGPKTMSLLNDIMVPVEVVLPDNHTMGDVVITYADNAPQVSEYSEGVLRDLAQDAGLELLYVTSTVREPDDQIRIMYDNIKRHGVEHSYAMYGSSGDKVTDAYVAKGKRESEALIKARMRRALDKVGGRNVSKHIRTEGLTVVDLAPSRIPAAKRVAFEAALAAALARGVVQYWLGPPKDPAYHIEIPDKTAHTRSK